MKKIPTLFERTFKEHNVVEIKPNVTKGMEWVLDGKGEATLKIDGTCSCILNGEFYKRYDAKDVKVIKDAVREQIDEEEIAHKKELDNQNQQQKKQSKYQYQMWKSYQKQ